MKLKNLLDDMDVYTSRLEELLQKLEGKLKEIPYIDKLLEIGMMTVSGFIAEVGDIRRFDNPKQLQKLAGYAIVANDSGKHNGESRIRLKAESSYDRKAGNIRDGPEKRPPKGTGTGRILTGQ